MWWRIAQSCLVLLSLAVAPVVEAQIVPMAVPENLRVPGQNVLLFKTLAAGTQVYVCKARADDPNQFAWTFKAPDAVLRNDVGEQVAKHYAGPSWEGNDGSTVMGEAVENAEAPDAASIPWLLLKAKRHDGSGVFSTVTYVQRLETVGGAAPTDGCDKSTVDAERGVEYTAVYVFYYSAA
jgi:hypothetical protein